MSLPAHNPSERRLSGGVPGVPQSNVPTPPTRPTSGLLQPQIPTSNSANRMSTSPTNTGVSMPNYQPSERRLSGGATDSPKFVPPRQAPPMPPGPVKNAPQLPSRTVPNVPGRAMPPQPQGILITIN